jgi:transcriptional regulator with XRE-family HTH domain
MEQTYLPGKVRERIQDLMKERGVTQTDLSEKLGISVATISRFISGKTDKLGDENLINIARAFDVSTDFLLGESDEPDRKNYDIGELGLSVQAARNLYTQRVDPRVVNRLLEHPRFEVVTHLVADYFEGTLAAGYAAQNQLLTALTAKMMQTSKASAKQKSAALQAARKMELLRTPIYQADLSGIEDNFMAAVKEIQHDLFKETANVKIDRARLMTKATTEKMYDDLSKGQDAVDVRFSPEEVADQIVASMGQVELKDPAVLEQLRAALVAFFENMVVTADDKRQQ